MLSRNSLRWKPSGSFWRMVCSMTRGPAKPISAPGSAMFRSPSMAKLAVTPPVVGSVSTLMNGTLASSRRISAAEILASCIRLTAPSCMRAPPEAETMISGLRAGRCERSMARVMLLAHHRAHAAADELQFQAQMLHRPPVQFAVAPRRWRRARPRLLHRRQPLAVGLRVDELRAGRWRSARVVISQLFAVEQHLQARQRHRAEVIVALRADLQVLFERLAPDDLAATLALQPEAFGA